MKPRFKLLQLQPRPSPIPSGDTSRKSFPTLTLKTATKNTAHGLRRRSITPSSHPLPHHVCISRTRPTKIWHYALKPSKHHPPPPCPLLPVVGVVDVRPVIWPRCTAARPRSIQPAVADGADLMMTTLLPMPPPGALVEEDR